MFASTQLMKDFSVSDAYALRAFDWFTEHYRQLTEDTCLHWRFDRAAIVRPREVPLTGCLKPLRSR
jgi:hypothetical protein